MSSGGVRRRISGKIIRHPEVLAEGSHEKPDGSLRFTQNNTTECECS